MKSSAAGAEARNGHQLEVTIAHMPEFVTDNGIEFRVVEPDE